MLWRDRSIDTNILSVEGKCKGEPRRRGGGCNTKYNQFVDLYTFLSLRLAAIDTSNGVKGLGFDGFCFIFPTVCAGRYILEDWELRIEF